MASLNPHFNGVSPVDLHRIYGVNCYQNALGIDSVTLHFNKKAEEEELTYLALYPGHMAEKTVKRDLSKKGDFFFNLLLPPTEMKQLTIDGCLEDGLKDLGEKSLADLPSLPEGERLISLFFSFDRSDFHFLAYDAVSGTWKDKFLFLEKKEYESFPENGTGTYLPVRFFAVPQNVSPQGIISGETFNHPEGVTLTIVKDPSQIIFGNTLSREKNGFRLRFNHQLYPAPDLSFVGV